VTIRTFSSREFNQYVSEAKRAADDGPVLITDRGEPAYALLNIRDYQKLQGRPRSLADALALPLDEAQIEFEPVPFDIQFKPADFS
jgi:prevent-host-death family protein